MFSVRLFRNNKNFKSVDHVRSDEKRVYACVMFTNFLIQKSNVMKSCEFVMFLMKFLKYLSPLSLILPTAEIVSHDKIISTINMYNIYKVIARANPSNFLRQSDTNPSPES